jgi:hypothetical protein
LSRTHEIRWEKENPTPWTPLSGFGGARRATRPIFLAFKSFLVFARLRRVSPWRSFHLRNLTHPNSGTHADLRCSPLKDRSDKQQRKMIMRGILLWLIGIPIPIIILLWLFGVLH